MPPTLFAAAYVDRTGREPQPYFDVMDIVGFLPPPGREGFIKDDERGAAATRGAAPGRHAESTRPSIGLTALEVDELRIGQAAQE